MLNHKKWLWISVLFVILSAGSGLVYIINHDSTEDILTPETIVLRFAETFSPNHPSAMAVKRFADLVEEKTNREISIEIYYESELGDESEVLEQVQFGGIALARVNLIQLACIIPELGSYLEPYLYDEKQEMMNTFDKNAQTIRDKMEIEKIIPLCWYYPDKRCFYNNKRSIESVADFFGLKLRAVPSPIIMNAMTALGANPINILFGDIYKSMRSGFIDGGETSLIEYYAGEFPEYSKYVTISDYLTAPDCIVASSVSFSRIPRNVQDIIQECARETIFFQKELLLEKQKECIEIMNGNGVKIIDSRELEEEMYGLLKGKL